jgi:hypothetical protein
MHTEQTAQPAHITPAEAAPVLGVHPSTIRRHAAALGGWKVLGRWRFDPTAVRQALGGAR